MNKPLRLLLVDGHDGVRTALRSRLERLPQVGAVLASGSIASAVALVRECAPDVVLCDPKTVGGPEPSAVRSLALGGGPVVVLTSSLQDGEEESFRRAGAAAVLLKGCGMSEILTTLESVATTGPSRAAIGEQNTSAAPAAQEGP